MTGGCALNREFLWLLVASCFKCCESWWVRVPVRVGDPIEPRRTALGVLHGEDHRLRAEQGTISCCECARSSAAGHAFSLKF